MKAIKKQYSKPSVLSVYAESVMAGVSTDNILVGGTSNKKRFVNGQNTGSSWTWTDDEGNDDSWTNQ